MTPALTAALAQPVVLLTGLIKIVLPSHTILLCDGSGVVTWGSDTFTGIDPVFGTIGEVESLTEQMGDSIPGIEMTMLPPSTSAAVTLATAAMQGAPVNLWLAAVDRATGAVVPDPELLFAGELDTATLQLDRGSREVRFSISSVWERLFEPNEGATLSSSFHKSIWPGELGFDNMTGTVIRKLWGPGEKAPVAAVPAPFPVTGVQRFF